MASYVELLGADQQRIRRALESLIAEEEQRVRELRRALEEHMSALDRRIIRTLVFRSIFGPTQSETLTAQADTEEASKPVTETTRELERSTLVLQALREALQIVESGATLDDLGRMQTPTRSRVQQGMTESGDGSGSGFLPPAAAS